MTRPDVPHATEPRDVLRVPEPRDAATLHALFDDPEIMRFVGDGSVRDLAYYEGFVRRQAEASRAEGVCLFLVEHDGAPAGFVGAQRWRLPWGPEADRINEAFVDMVQASVAPVRKPLPFTKMKKGVDGRAFLVDYFTRETLRRRAEGGGQDMFSQFATATREDGSLLPVDEVVDHMNFLMSARGPFTRCTSSHKPDTPLTVVPLSQTLAEPDENKE